MSENHFSKLLHHAVSQEIFSQVWQKNIIIYKIYPKESHHFLFFFWGWIMATWWQKKVKWNLYQGFLFKRQAPKLPDFEEFVFLGLPYLDNCLQVVAKIEFSVKSPCFWASFHPSILSFEWGPQCKEILLNLGMKCWNSAFNLQGPRLIIVVVQVGAMKIYVEALRKKERGSKTRWNSVYHPKKRVLFWVSTPMNANVNCLQV